MFSCSTKIVWRSSKIATMPSSQLAFPWCTSVTRSRTTSCQCWIGFINKPVRQKKHGALCPQMSYSFLDLEFRVAFTHNCTEFRWSFLHYCLIGRPNKKVGLEQSVVVFHSVLNFLEIDQFLELLIEYKEIFLLTWTFISDADIANWTLTVFGSIQMSKMLSCGW